jgi:hypothetical protein
MPLEAELDRVVEALNVVEAERRDYPSPNPETWFWKYRGPKFIAIDIGRRWESGSLADGELHGSGAFLVEKATGELYNIKGYGRPDYNKKRKADLGNIATVDPRLLHAKRWNYLR